MYVCMYVCMCACMCACMYVCMYVCMHVCMYVPVCVCVCLHLFMCLCAYLLSLCVCRHQTASSDAHYERCVFVCAHARARVSVPLSLSVDTKHHQLSQSTISVSLPPSGQGQTKRTVCLWHLPLSSQNSPIPAHLYRTNTPRGSEGASVDEPLDSEQDASKRRQTWLPPSRACWAVMVSMSCSSEAEPWGDLSGGVWLGVDTGVLSSGRTQLEVPSVL